MKLVIKVGEATIEVEGENLKTTRVAGAGIPVEVIMAKSKEEALQETLDRLAMGLSEVLIREQQAGNL